MFPPDAVSASVLAFSLIGLAEIGDKSQIACVALAARHRHWPVLMGAGAAFLILNTLAVVFGAGVAAWVPERVTAGIVALLFALFGLHALRAERDDEPEVQPERPSHSIFLTTLSLIFVAEFGDKTQIAVAGLASTMPPVPVWIGATTALILVSALGVWVGRKILQHLPTLWLHRVAGGLFLVFAFLAAWRAVS